MTLEELTALENEWLAKHPSRGFMEQRDAFLQRNGVYDAWRRIFAEYVALARLGDLEALKRALFLAWYEQAEPSPLSGLYLLDGTLKEEVFQMLEDLAARDGFDDELEWMLPYYYMIADWYLMSGFDRVASASTRHVRLWQKRCLGRSFDNRGQLGVYWASIQEGQKRRRFWHALLGVESRVGRALLAARVAWQDRARGRRSRGRDGRGRSSWGAGG